MLKTIPLLLLCLTYPAIFYRTSAYYSFIKLPLFYAIASIGLVLFLFSRELRAKIYVCQGIIVLYLALLLFHAQEWNQLAHYFILFGWVLLVSQIDSSTARMQKLLLPSIVGGGIGVLALAFSITPKTGNTRLMFPMGNPNFLAAYFIWLLVCTTAWLFRPSVARYGRWALVAVFSATLYGFWQTDSSGGSLALALSTISYFLLVKGNVRLAGLLLSVGVLLLVTAVVVCGGVDGALVWFAQRFPVRAEGIMAGLSMWGASPWLGHGEGAFFNLFPTHATEGWHTRDGFGAFLASAHNEYIEVLVSHGIIGLVIFIGILLFPIISYIKNPRRVAIPFLATHVGWLAFIGVSVAMRSHVFQVIFWTNFGILLSTSRPYRRFSMTVKPILNKILRLASSVFLIFAVGYGVRAFFAEQSYLAGRLLIKNQNYILALERLRDAERSHIDFKRRALIRMNIASCYGHLGLWNEQLAMYQLVEKTVPAFQFVRKKIAFLTYSHVDKAEGMKLMLNELKRDRFYTLPRRYVMAELAKWPTLEPLRAQLSPLDWQCASILRQMGQGKYSEALQSIEELPPGHRTIAWPAMLKARCLRETGQIEAAMSLYRNHVKNNPSSAEGYLGMIYTCEKELSYLPKDDVQARKAVLVSLVTHLDVLSRLRLERFTPEVIQEMIRLMIIYKHWQGAYVKLKDLWEVGYQSLPNALRLTEVCLELDRPEEAKRTLQEAMQIYTNPTEKERQRGQALAQRIEESLRGQ